MSKRHGHRPPQPSYDSISHGNPYSPYNADDRGRPAKSIASVPSGTQSSVNPSSYASTAGTPRAPDLAPRRAALDGALAESYCSQRFDKLKITNGTRPLIISSTRPSYHSTPPNCTCPTMMWTTDQSGNSVRTQRCMDQQMTILVAPTSTGYVPVLLHPDDPYKELPSSHLSQAPSSIDVTRKNGQRYLNSMMAKRFPAGATSASEILNRLQSSEALTNPNSQDLAQLRKMCNTSGMDLQVVAWSPASNATTGDRGIDDLTSWRVENLLDQTPDLLRVPQIK